MIPKVPGKSDAKSGAPSKEDVSGGQV